jgi:PII-like signaling protein
MFSYLVVAIGGALGSVGRFWLSGAIAQKFGETFPAGTLLVNISGSLIIGFLLRSPGPMVAFGRVRPPVFHDRGARGLHHVFFFQFANTRSRPRWRVALRDAQRDRVIRALSVRSLARRLSRDVAQSALVFLEYGSSTRFDVVADFIGESDRWNHQPLYEAIVLKAREMHLGGATVLRGPMGFGKSSRMHTAKILRLSMDLPIVIEIVDSERKINAFLPALEGMMSGGW